MLANFWESKQQRVLEEFWALWDLVYIWNFQQEFMGKKDIGSKFGSHHYLN